MDTAQLQVRGVSPHGGASFYHYFDSATVTPERAVELARFYAFATCHAVAYFEVRPDAYPRLNAPPIYVASA